MYFLKPFQRTQLVTDGLLHEDYDDDVYFIRQKVSKCLPFGLKDRGLLILILPDVSPASVAGIFRRLRSWVVARSLLNVLCFSACEQRTFSRLRATT